MANLRTSFIITEPLAGGNSSIRDSFIILEPLSGGESRARLSNFVTEPLSGGNAFIRLSSFFIEVLCGIPKEPFVVNIPFPIKSANGGPDSSPGLIGLSWSVHKKPTFKTRISQHQSAKEIRSAIYPYPPWEFNLTYDYLPNDPSKVVGDTDLQVMMGFFLQMQGSANYFLFQDPKDYHVVGHKQFVGDSATTQIGVIRVLGGFPEKIGQVDLSSWATFASGAVNVGANTITIPNHGMTTGSTPLFITTDTSLPGGLAVATPYWPIVIDADTIKLAVNSVQANLGIPLTISSAGTGNQTFSKGWAVYQQVFEGHTIPSSGPYTLTAAHASHFNQNLGASIGGTQLTDVTGSPGPGQYSVNLSTGVYTFNAAQAGASVTISYNWIMPSTDVSLTLPNLWTFSSAIPSADIITADFDFFFVCRFLEDQMDFEEFYDKLWQLQKCDFTSVPQ